MMLTRRRRSRIAAGIMLVALLLSACSPAEFGGRGQSSPTPAPPSPQEPAAAAADRIFGFFEPIHAEGRGETVVPLSAEIGDIRAGIVRMTYRGETPLVLWSLDEDGVEQMILIDGTIGINTVDPAAFDGETMWWAANPPPRALRVEGDGDWQLSVLPVSSAPSLRSEGHGTRVFLYDGPGGSFPGRKKDMRVGMSVTEISLRYDGGSIAEAVPDRNGADEFMVVVQRGPSVLIVTHRGDWWLDLPFEEW